MNRKTKKVLFSVGITILLGGCTSLINSNNNQKNEQAKETQAAPSDHSLISVQDYTGEGYALPYGKVTDKIADENLDGINDATIKFFKETYKDENTENLRKVYDEDSFNPENIKINIQLFMADMQANPSEEIFNHVTAELEEMNSIPKGTYSFSLNDNFIDKQSAEGAKDNSLKRGFPDYIIKK